MLQISPRQFFIAIAAMLYLNASSITAQSSIIPSIDPTFNTTGNVHLDGTPFFEPFRQIVQPDGKILAAGYGKLDLNGTFDAIIYRLNNDGSMDQGFANQGFFQLDVDGSSEFLADIKLLQDGKILILLQSTLRVLLVKLLPNGAMDTSFGNEGFVLTSSPANELLMAMAIQSDGKIVACGYQGVSANINKGVVRRFNANGSDDTTYGTMGKVSVVIDAAKNLALTQCALLSDGRFVATGEFGAGIGSGFPLICLNQDGSFDNTFSGDGIYTKTLGNLSNSAIAESIAVTSADNILVGGSAPTSTGNVMTILSVKPNGTSNTTFGSFGVAKIIFGLYDTVRDMVIQPDGKIICCGYAFRNQTQTAMTYARLQANGLIDNTFGDNQGRLAVELNNGQKLQAIVAADLAPDGRLVSTAWMSQTLNLGAPGNLATCYVFRYLSDITIKANEPSVVFRELSVSPNPVSDNEALTLNYQLENPCDVSLLLYDATGRSLATLMIAQQRAAGNQTEQFYLPEGLTPGTYFLQLSTQNGYKVIKIVKQ